MAKAKKTPKVKTLNFKVIEMGPDFEPTGTEVKLTKAQLKLAKEIQELATEVKAHERYFEALEELNEAISAMAATVDSDKYQVEVDGEPLYEDEFGIGQAASIADVWLPSSMSC